MFNVSQKCSLRRLAIMLVFSCLAAVLPAAGQEPVRPGEHGLKVGEKAPEFRLKGADGKEYALADLCAGGKVALVF